MLIHFLHLIVGALDSMYVTLNITSAFIRETNGFILSRSILIALLLV